MARWKVAALRACSRLPPRSVDGWVSRRHLTGRTRLATAHHAASHATTMTRAASLYLPFVAAALQRVGHAHALLRCRLRLEGDVRHGFVALIFHVTDGNFNLIQIQSATLFQVFDYSSLNRFFVVGRTFAGTYESYGADQNG